MSVSCGEEQTLAFARLLDELSVNDLRLVSSAIERYLPKEPTALNDKVIADFLRSLIVIFGKDPMEFLVGLLIVHPHCLKGRVSNEKIDIIKTILVNNITLIKEIVDRTLGLDRIIEEIVVSREESNGEVKARVKFKTKSGRETEFTLTKTQMADLCKAYEAIFVAGEESE